jgi:hypothetical protein
MKILKNYINDKQIFAANYRKDKEFLRRGKYEFRPRANDNVPNPKSCNSADRIKLNLLDKAGLDSSFDIIRGNILLIGNAADKLLSLSIRFHKIFLQSGFVTQIINFSQFTNLSFIEQANPKFYYLVRFDEHDDASVLPHSFYAYFSNIFVFALKDITPYEGYDAPSKLDKKTGIILSKLEREKLFARKQLSLLKENEFLSINREGESFQSINMDKGGL